MIIALSTQPASADDLHTNRAKTQARQAQVQVQLDLSRSSDTQVEAEVNRLNAEVTASGMRLENARSEEHYAANSVTRATIRLAAIGNSLDQTRQRLREASINAYVQPLTPVLTAGSDPNELVRARELLATAVGNQRDALDAFRAAKVEQARARRDLQAALVQAAKRTQVFVAQAKIVAAADRALQIAHNALHSRIVGLLAESRDLAVQESEIQALIAQQDAAARAAMLAAQQRAAAAIAANARARVTSGPSPISNGGLIWPIHGRVTSEFGPRWGGFHPGIDIAAPDGTPITAVKTGFVIFAGWAGGYGNFVLIDLGNGIVTGYAHQSRIAVTQGQIVNQCPKPAKLRGRRPVTRTAVDSRDTGAERMVFRTRQRVAEMHKLGIVRTAVELRRTTNLAAERTRKAQAPTEGSCWNGTAHTLTVLC